MSDVFVSYASADRERAARVVQMLQHQKWRVFWDRNIPAGKKWSDVLRVQLYKARCVVVLLSRSSLRSGWVSFEASVALHRDILVPILLDADIDPQTDLPEFYRDLHVLRLQFDASAPDASSGRATWIADISRNLRKATRRRLMVATVSVLLLFLSVLASFYIAVTGHNIFTMWQTDVWHLERGAYSKQENDRLKRRIREAGLIELLAPNANSFTSAFREDLAIFLGHKGGRMKALFANPESEFYGEMMSVTSRSVASDKKARESDKGLPARSRQVLIDFATGDPSRIEFRQFNTEFRVPIILIDRKYCFLTVRLTPDQSTESIRLELIDTSRGGDSPHQALASVIKRMSFDIGAARPEVSYVESCKRHFDAIWARSKVFE